MGVEESFVRVRRRKGRVLVTEADFDISDSAAAAPVNKPAKINTSIPSFLKGWLYPEGWIRKFSARLDPDPYHFIIMFLKIPSEVLTLKALIRIQIMIFFYRYN